MSLADLVGRFAITIGLSQGTIGFGAPAHSAAACGGPGRAYSLDKQRVFSGKRAFRSLNSLGFLALGFGPFLPSPSVRTGECRIWALNYFQQLPSNGTNIYMSVQI
jgi:hypothetical protein